GRRAVRTASFSITAALPTSTFAVAGRWTFCWAKSSLLEQFAVECSEVGARSPDRAPGRDRRSPSSRRGDLRSATGPGQETGPQRRVYLARRASEGSLRPLLARRANLLPGWRSTAP